MDPVTGALAGAAVGSLGNIASSAYATKKNMQAAQDNRKFQRTMSNTAYQRAAADLEKAGLNRIIAMGSPASTPSGSVGSAIDSKAGSAASEGWSAASVRRVNAETVKLLQEQQIKTRHEAAAAAEQAANIRADTSLKSGQANQIPFSTQEIQARIKELEERVKTYPANMGLAEAQTKRELQMLKQIREQTRLFKIQGDVEDVKKTGWQVAQPWIEWLGSMVPRPDSNTAKDISERLRQEMQNRKGGKSTPLHQIINGWLYGP